MQLKQWKWVVSLVMATWCGLVALPTGFSQTGDGCTDIVITGGKGGKCPATGQPKKLISSVVEIQIVFVDCAIDFEPSNLNAGGANKHKTTILHCELVDEGTVFEANVSDIDPATTTLNKCDVWPDCLEIPANFSDFQHTGLRPVAWSLNNFDQLVLQYNERDLFNLFCATTVRTLAVIGELVSGAVATATDGGGETLDIGGAIIRGMDIVVCLP